MGGASNKLMAKVACESAKPGGVRVLAPHRELSVPHSLDVSDVPGIGAATAAKPAEFQVSTVADLAAVDLDDLVRRFGPARGEWLYAVARNEYAEPVTSSPSPAQSISLSETYPTDLTSTSQVSEALGDLAACLWLRLLEEDRTPSTFGVTVRSDDFVTRSHSTSPAAPPRSSAELAE